MVRTKLNPFVVTILALIACVTLGLIITCFIGNGAELAAVMNTIYFTPIVCFLVFNTLLVLNRSWRRHNVSIIFVVDLVLIGWIITIVIHIYNLFD